MSLLACGTLPAADSPSPTTAAEIAGTAPPPPAPGQGAPLPWLYAVALGVVEGVTEYLPISSTGHLILTGHALDLDHEDVARDRAGQPLWAKKPDAARGKPGEPLTVKAATDTYVIMIQVGAIAAVVGLYWRTVLAVLHGLLGRNAAGLRLCRNLLLAFLPAVVAGLTLRDFIDQHLFSVRVVIAALSVGALLMLAADRWQRSPARRQGPDLALEDLSPGQSLLIGLCQCFALWPGMSRSMATILGGYVVGLRPARAAEFSFLLGLPTLTAAAVLKGASSGREVLAAFGTAPSLLGAAVAAVAAAVSVRWMVHYLQKHGLALFAWYRLALAVVVVVLLR